MSNLQAWTKQRVYYPHSISLATVQVLAELVLIVLIVQLTSTLNFDFTPNTEQCFSEHARHVIVLKYKVAVFVCKLKIL